MSCEIPLARIKYEILLLLQNTETHRREHSTLRIAPIIIPYPHDNGCSCKAEYSEHTGGRQDTEVLQQT
jgi:hypothetical protein